VTIIVTPTNHGSILTVPDTCLGGTTLLIKGTSANDTILVEPGTTAGTLSVIFNGVSTVVPRPSGRIIISGGDGDDNLQIAGSVGSPAWLYGDSGNDRLNAGAGGSLLIGGAGNDQLLGGSGRDVMVGGSGADYLIGNSNDDILIASLTNKDGQSAVGHEHFWCHILTEWNSPDDFSVRIANLRD
jgi:Ca2+-binding RTX toxin-like protein